MEVDRNSVKAKSQAGNIWVKDVSRYSAREILKTCILQENSAEGLRAWRERYWRYIVSVKQSSHIAKVSVEATFLHFNPWCILKEMIESWHPWKNAKPNSVI